MVQVPDIRPPEESFLMKLVRLFMVFSLLALLACERQTESGATSKAGVKSGLDISTTEAPRIGFKAPNFTLKDLNGKTVSLAAMRGRVVIINFWATWCGPCKVEMPSMNSLYNDLKGKDFELLAISSDVQGEKVVRPFVTQGRFTFPVLLDSSFRVNGDYGISGIPTTFVVDKDGVITHKILGPRDWDSPEARELIRRIMSSKA